MIKLHLDITSSKATFYGPSFWSFIATDPQTSQAISGSLHSTPFTGRSVSYSGTVAISPTNLFDACDYLGLRSGEMEWTGELRHLIRPWSEGVANYPDAGAHSWQIANYIRSGLGWESNTQQYTVLANTTGVHSNPHWLEASGAEVFCCGLTGLIPTGTQIPVTNYDFNALWQRRVQGKVYTVCDVDPDHHRHIVRALDGEAWQFACHPLPTGSAVVITSGDWTAYRWAVPY